ncbi:MAG: hypothetical protein JW940_20360 [Polyangiaceae bacterium]|nr:hypothetical protein [Polyangiaceae bacterium]
MPAHWAWGLLALALCGALWLGAQSWSGQQQAQGPSVALERSAPAIADWLARRLVNVHTWTVAPELVSDPFERLMSKAGNTVLIPADCLPWDGPYDVIIHFHGVYTALEPALARSGLAAVMVITEDGIGARAYSQKYQFEGSLDWLLRGVQTLMQARCPMPGRRIGRVTLSAWSAGYAAVQQILSWPENFDRVDAVLLEDGLHARLNDDGTVAERDMRPFVDFAREAVAENRLMAITHSAIVTNGYASTTETTDYLLDALGIERVSESGAVNSYGMVLTSSADEGALHLRGYAGEDRAAHGAHQRAVGITLLPTLRQWWSAR